jgi:hypothetical protein
MYTNFENELKGIKFLALNNFRSCIKHFRFDNCTVFTPAGVISSSETNWLDDKM